MPGEDTATSATDAVNLGERQDYVNSMKSFLEEQNDKLMVVLGRLGINSEDLFNQETKGKQICPYNKDHIVPEKSFKRHVECCKLLSAGHQRDELPALLQDLDQCYENANSILKVDIDENLLNRIIWDHCIQNGQVYTGHRNMPSSHIDEAINLTQEDRLAVYQYVVSKSHEAGKVIPVDRYDDLLTTDWGSLVKKGLLDEQNNKQYSSKLEQLAALRDFKRRRQSYRAKNVHITKKSYTEIIREVISNQMEILVPERDNSSNPSTNQEDGISERGAKGRCDSRDQGRDYSHSQRHKSRSSYNDEKYAREGKSTSSFTDRGYKDSSRDDSPRDRCYTYHQDDEETQRRDRYEDSKGRRRRSDRSKERYKDHRRDSPDGRDRSERRYREHRSNNADSIPIDRPRRFTEADDLLLKEIKKETLSHTDGNDYAPSSGEITQEISEEASHDDPFSKSEGMSRKRDHSETDSDDSSSKKSKRKKSKHKKKHSKKHKRKN